jgi:hypothetical protein
VAGVPAGDNGTRLVRPVANRIFNRQPPRLPNPQPIRRQIKTRMGRFTVWAFDVNYGAYTIPKSCYKIIPIFYRMIAFNKMPAFAVA